MKSKIIEQWEDKYYQLGTAKKQKLMLKSNDEIISILKSMAEMPAITKFGE